jgi:hypothetical protein
MGIYDLGKGYDAEFKATDVKNLLEFRSEKLFTG